MEITNDTRSLVAKGLRDKKMNQAELAKKLGVDRSWTTRFFQTNGGLKTVSDDLMWKMQDALGIKFYENSQGESFELSRQIAAAIEKDARLGSAFEMLLRSINDDHYYDLPLIPTKDLVDFGKEIMRVAIQDSEKPGKVGKIALVWLADRLQKLKH